MIMDDQPVMVAYFGLRTLVCLMIAPCSLLLILVCKDVVVVLLHLKPAIWAKRICQLLEQQWRQFLHFLHLPHVY